MKIEIIKVEKKEVEEITTNQDTFNLYRRFEADHWEHLLGLDGWVIYRFSDVIEQAYQAWKLKQRKLQKESPVT